MYEIWVYDKGGILNQRRNIIQQKVSEPVHRAQDMKIPTSPFIPVAISRWVKILM